MTGPPGGSTGSGAESDIYDCVVVGDVRRDKGDDEGGQRAGSSQGHPRLHGRRCGLIRLRHHLVQLHLRRRGRTLAQQELRQAHLVVTVYLLPGRVLPSVVPQMTCDPTRPRNLCPVKLVSRMSGYLSPQDIFFPQTNSHQTIGLGLA